jgi:hypothetical protein
MLNKQKPGVIGTGIYGGILIKEASLVGSEPDEYTKFINAYTKLKNMETKLKAEKNLLYSLKLKKLIELESMLSSGEDIKNFLINRKLKRKRT